MTFTVGQGPKGPRAEEVFGAIGRRDEAEALVGAQQGYPFLEKALEPGALNALHIFDHERAPVYIDDCCHYTLAGNRLLADFIAKAVVNAPAPRTLPNH